MRNYQKSPEIIGFVPAPITEGMSLNEILEANLKKRMAQERPDALPAKSQPTTEDDSKINSCNKSGPEAEPKKQEATPSIQY